MRVIHALDWLGRIDVQDLTKVPPQDLPVSLDAAMRGIPMRTRSGGVLIGYPAMRRALVQTPLGFLPALLMYLPGVSHVGTMVYDWIARHRRRACELPPVGV
jgi:hypothetical protein